MSLRNQPYLPLYVQDFLTDEKLMECGSSATGIYIRVMCIMHKSDHYGKLLLRQKDKQTDQQIKNFALKLAKHLPYNLNEIEAGLNELINENVLKIEGDFLFQKRMVKDNNISELRSEAGKKGAQASKKFAKAKGKAKGKAKLRANSENATANEDVNDINTRKVKFENEVMAFTGKYEKAMLVKFIGYWSELNRSKTKMKFELQETWDLPGRLAYWYGRQDNFKTKTPEQPRPIPATDNKHLFENSTIPK